ncbi:MAG: GTPase Era [Enterobacteriaceae bacterium]|nr:GTPase Era [Enterobacteriaceae bacterium]
MIYNKCGLISIIGRTNVGKSTLLNSILHKKLSITNKKINTTNDRINGIKTIENNQFIFIDTPGLIIKENINKKIINKKIINAILESDILLLVIEAFKVKKEEYLLMEIIKKANKPIILIINKIDKIKEKEKLLPFISNIIKKIKVNKIITISAKEIININILEKYVSYLLPIKNHIYKQNIETNITEIFFIKEIIREKLMCKLKHEIPYTSKIIIENTKNTKEILIVKAIIQTEKQSQKPIIIGKNGKVIKEIGIAVKNTLENIYKKKILIKIIVQTKVELN